MPPRSDGAPKTSSLRRALGPLIAYHALVLGGGFLVIDGWLRSSDLEISVGALVLAAGVATAIAVLRWAAHLARAPSVAGTPDGLVVRWVCPRCTLESLDRRATCRRCGAVVVPQVRSGPRVVPGSPPPT
jgi:hypothetical protein